MANSKNNAPLDGKRRAFLKGLGVVSTSGLGLDQIGTASANNGAEEFVGHTYDPVTHQVYGPATAKLTRTVAGVRGVLNTENRQIPLELGNPSQSPAPDEIVKHCPHNAPLSFKTVHKYPDQPDLTLGLYSANGITGYYSLSTDRGRTAFKLSKVARHKSTTAAHKATAQGIQMKRGVKRVSPRGDR